MLAAGADAFGDVELDPEWITDLELRANVTDTLQLAVGSNNLFDIYPTKIPTGLGTDPASGAARAYPATNYVATYSSFSPYGFNGRFVYARASFRF